MKKERILKLFELGMVFDGHESFVPVYVTNTNISFPCHNKALYNERVSARVQAVCKKSAGPG